MSRSIPPAQRLPPGPPDRPPDARAARRTPSELDSPPRAPHANPRLHPSCLPFFVFSAFSAVNHSTRCTGQSFNRNERNERREGRTRHQRGVANRPPAVPLHAFLGENYLDNRGTRGRRTTIVRGRRARGAATASVRRGLPRWGSRAARALERAKTQNRKASSRRSGGRRRRICGER
jgi:hypothetical protein